MHENLNILANLKAKNQKHFRWLIWSSRGFLSAKPVQNKISSASVPLKCSAVFYCTLVPLFCVF